MLLGSTCESHCFTNSLAYYVRVLVVEEKSFFFCNFNLHLESIYVFFQSGIKIVLCLKAWRISIRNAWQGLSVCPSVLSVHLSVTQSVCLSLCMLVDLPVCPFEHLPACMSVCKYCSQNATWRNYLSFFHLCFQLFILLLVCLFVCLSTSLFVHMSVFFFCTSVCLSMLEQRGLWSNGTIYLLSLCFKLLR